MHGPLYLDDLAVGSQFTSGEHAMDEAQIKAFALQFDPQPFHLDDEAARSTLFGGLAASGWHTAAITMNLTRGTILATVVSWLMNAASLIPRSTRKCTAHSSTEAQPMAIGVLPWPNTGKK